MRLPPRLFTALLICLIAIPALAIPVTPCLAQPLMPHAFYGSVTINGTPAATGTVVEARGEGVLTGIEDNPITVTEAGKYGGQGGLDPKLVVQGNITAGTSLTFYVNNVTAQCYDVQAGGEWLDSYPFKSGDITILNLKVGESPPIEPDISVFPTAKNFGNITVDSSSSPQNFTVRNVGYADLVVGTISITGTNADQFAIRNDNASNQTIIPGVSAPLQVVFTPTSTGAKSAILNIPSNDPDEATVLVPLSGTGVTEEAAIPPTPANFTVTSLDLSSEQVKPGQEVLVTVNVTNSGGCEGSYTLNLTINGAVEQTRTVTLAPLAANTVTFSVTKEEPGNYTISVDGVTKEFTVVAIAPSWLSRYWWTIVVGVVVIGLLLFSLRWWRPKKAVGS